MPLGRDPEKKGDYTSGHLPWGVSRSSQRLGILVLGSDAVETTPLASWKTTESDRKAGEDWTPLISSMREQCAYLGSAPGAAQISDGVPLPQLTLQHSLRIHAGSHQPCGVVPQQGRGGKGRGE